MIRHERILDDFISERLSQHKEPTRKGVPKGEPIGPPRHKVHASILCALTALTLKDISSELEVSYDLLMKWNTQEDFQSLMEGHVDNFTAYFLRRIAEHAEALRKGRREAPKGHIVEGRYGFGLLLNICQEIRDTVKAKDPFFAVAAYLAVEQLKRVAEHESWPHKRELDKHYEAEEAFSDEGEGLVTPMKVLERVADRMEATFVDFAMKALEGKSKRDRDSATLMLALLRKTLEERR